MGVRFEFREATVKLGGLLRCEVWVNPAEFLAVFLPDPFDEGAFLLRRHWPHLLDQVSRAHVLKLHSRDLSASDKWETRRPIPAAFRDKFILAA